MVFSCSVNLKCEWMICFGTKFHWHLSIGLIMSHSLKLWNHMHFKNRFLNIFFLESRIFFSENWKFRSNAWCVLVNGNGEESQINELMHKSTVFNGKLFAKIQIFVVFSRKFTLKCTSLSLQFSFLWIKFLVLFLGKQIWKRIWKKADDLLNSLHVIFWWKT